MPYPTGALVAGASRRLTRRHPDWAWFWTTTISMPNIGIMSTASNSNPGIYKSMRTKFSKKYIISTIFSKMISRLSLIASSQNLLVSKAEKKVEKKQVRNKLKSRPKRKKGKNNNNKVRNSNILDNSHNHKHLYLSQNQNRNLNPKNQEKRGKKEKRREQRRLKEKKLK